MSSADTAVASAAATPTAAASDARFGKGSWGAGPFEQHETIPNGARRARLR